MEEILKQMNETRITLDLTIGEANKLKKILDKSEMKKAKVAEDGNKCPNCSKAVTKDGFYCPLCGQRYIWNDSDVIPL